ncbi:hypothetical protein LIER_07834 [Lithospermum erythrorhizon]|uniref:Uncharacterized protein n=1 Tax=Lithospermum erythrorhizon TaxID=34254 RepID=A0AAV3PDK2_LITER
MVFDTSSASWELLTSFTMDDRKDTNETGVSTRAQSALGDTNNHRLDIPPNTQRRSQKPLREEAPGHGRASSEGSRASPKSTQADMSREEGQVPRQEEPLQNEPHQ